MPVEVPLKLFTVDDLMKMTGLSRKTILRLYHEGHIKGAPPRGLTRPILFKPEDVRDWIEDGRS